MNRRELEKMEEDYHRPADEDHIPPTEWRAELKEKWIKAWEEACDELLDLL